MKKNLNKSKAFLIGYLTFFITFCFIVSISILTFEFVDKASDGNKLILSITMLCCILVSAFLCTLIDVIRRKIMIERPVHKILEATKKITNGDFTVKLTPSHSYERYDEFDRIMENLNIMALELSKNEILRSDFISNVSHEIKTPLAIIQNYATAINDMNLDSNTRKKYTDTLVSASKRLTNLVVNILKLNKLENQEIMPEIEKIGLGEMLRETILVFEELIDEKNIQLECDIEDINIFSSYAYLEIIWKNLLSNAIKFTEKNGQIMISVKRENRNVYVKISDTGCGISNETGKLIFEKFYQGDTSHSQEGNGLGLALVKRVIDILGGEISVESVINEGSTFTVKLKGLIYDEI